MFSRKLLKPAKLAGFILHIYHFIPLFTLSYLFCEDPGNGLMLLKINFSKLSICELLLFNDCQKHLEPLTSFQTMRNIRGHNHRFPLFDG